MKDALSADNPFILIGQAHLARWTGEAGDLAHARELAAAAVEEARCIEAKSGDRDSGFYLRKFAWTKIIRRQMVKGTSSVDDRLATFTYVSSTNQRSPGTCRQRRAASIGNGVNVVPSGKS